MTPEQHAEVLRAIRDLQREVTTIRRMVAELHAHTVWEQPMERRAG